MLVVPLEQHRCCCGRPPPCCCLMLACTSAYACTRRRHQPLAGLLLGRSIAPLQRLLSILWPCCVLLLFFVYPGICHLWGLVLASTPCGTSTSTTHANARAAMVVVRARTPLAADSPAGQSAASRHTRVVHGHWLRLTTSAPPPPVGASGTVRSFASGSGSHERRFQATFRIPSFPRVFHLFIPFVTYGQCKPSPQHAYAMGTFPPGFGVVTDARSRCSYSCCTQLGSGYSP